MEEYMTEADCVKAETGSRMAAYRIRGLIELVGRDAAIEILEDYNI